MADRCVRFWGPFTPVLGGEQTLEIGTSFYLSPALLCVTRSLSALFLIIAATFALQRGFLRVHAIQRYIAIICGTSFALLALVSLQAALERPRNALPARVVAPLHFVASSFALLGIFVSVESLILRSNATVFAGHSVEDGSSDVYIFVQYFAPALLVGVDFAMGAMIRFRLFYVIFAQLALGAHTTAVLLKHRWVGRRWSAFLIRHIVILISSFLLVVISRLCLWCKYGRVSYESDADEV